MTAIKNNRLLLRYALLVVLSCATQIAAAQEPAEKIIGVDSTGSQTTTIDSSEGKKVRVYSPKKAALRSAILPGLGQIYNKKYWKLPIVYGALGTSAGVFIFNYNWYKRTKYAYKVLSEGDVANYDNVHPKLRRLVDAGQLETIKYYRDEYRRDIDYSVLFFVVLWGLNIVDAAVDAHLKAFDVSPDLSFKFKPGHSEMAGTTGLSFVMTIGKNINHKPLKLP
jgi:hypothetical protein